MQKRFKNNLILFGMTTNVIVGGVWTVDEESKRTIYNNLYRFDDGSTNEDDGQLDGSCLNTSCNMSCSVKKEEKR